MEVRALGTTTRDDMEGELMGIGGLSLCEIVSRDHSTHQEKAFYTSVASLNQLDLPERGCLHRNRVK